MATIGNTHNTMKATEKLTMHRNNYSKLTIITILKLIWFELFNKKKARKFIGGLPLSGQIAGKNSLVAVCCGTCRFNDSGMCNNDKVCEKDYENWVQQTEH